MSYPSHKSSAQSITARCAIVTLSDTRDQSTDTSGALIRELLEKDGHTIAHYQVLLDDPDQFSGALDALLGRHDVDVIVTNGGTGVSRRDNTIPVIAQRIQTQLPGFGELFRMLSYHQIGSGAMLSRALAGVTKETKLLFALPGSSKAVELAMSKLILPELRHLLFELRK